MILLENKMLITIILNYCAVIDVIAGTVKFTARPNEYFQSSASKFGTRSKIECCTKCGEDLSCLGTNYNRNSSECELLTQHAGSSTSNVVPVPEWDLLTIDGCADTWYSYSRSCYKVVETRMTWEDADAHCKTYSAELVDINSFVERSLVIAMVESYNMDDGVWIGLNDIADESRFRWSSGKPVTISDFPPTEPVDGPDVDCVMLITLSPDIGWYARNCFDLVPFICEKPDRSLFN